MFLLSAVSAVTHVLVMLMIVSVAVEVHISLLFINLSIDGLWYSSYVHVCVHASRE